MNQFFNDFGPGITLILVVWLIGKGIDWAVRRNRKAASEPDAHEIFPGHL